MRSNIVINSRRRSLFRRGGTNGFLLILVIVLLAVGAFAMFRDMKGPEITVSPNIDRITPDQNITLTMTDADSYVKSVAVFIRYSGESVPIFEHAFESKQQTQKLAFSLKEAGLKDGAFTMEIVARDSSMAGLGRGNSTTVTKQCVLDTQPPKIELLTPPATLRRGGVAVFVYTLNEAVGKTGATAEGIYFPSFELAKNKFCCFIAFPLNAQPGLFKAELTAVDLAGNVGTMKLPIQFQDRAFNTDRMKITDAFLNKKATDFEVLAPEGKMTNLERYLYINGTVRRQNEEFLTTLAARTSNKMLWSGNFIRLPGSALRARYGDSRTYFYNEMPVDHQVHMGLDLASTRHAPIPASNDGIVVFSGPLGIFGNLVVVDHGLGLMSLYSHMSQIFVAEGEKVKKGQTIATTGTTGLAGGDHLHFGMLLNGIQVQPLDWLDNGWVASAIANRVANALKR